MLDLEIDIVLPYNVFFKPTKVFDSWILDKKLIIDCGAGCGYLGKLYPKKVFGIDLRRRTRYYSYVLNVDARCFKFPKNSTALIARPSGEDWVYDVFKNAHNQNIDVFYVGLSKNYDRDLFSFDNIKAEFILDKVGQQGEQLWKVLKNEI